MNWRWAVALFLTGLGVNIIVARFQTAPGYMDADYYYAGGLRMASGEGWSEPFLWNFLDDPAGIPHPAFTYWMPLAGLLAAAGMRLTGWFDFAGARTGSILLSALVPPMTAWLAYSFTPARWAALLAGLLAVFSGFYLPYQLTTDTFTVCMLLGILWFQLLRSLVWPEFLPRSAPAIAFGLGLTAGLFHLARADGIVWLVLAVLAIGYEGFQGVRKAREPGEVRSGGPSVYRLGTIFLLCIAGYLLVMGGWYVRNLAVFGSLFSPAGGRVLWISRYDEIFAYPASLLTPLRWWSLGFSAILGARVWAFWQNLQTLLAVQGEVFLLLLVVPGIWAFRRDVRIRWGLVASAALFLLMTLVFPYPGARGGFFHSGAALQPLWWAVVPAGLQVWLIWGERKRGWDPGSARRVFAGGMVGLALLFTLMTTYSRLISPEPVSQAWGASSRSYRQLGDELRRITAGSNTVVMVNNPPAFFAETGRSAIPIPDGDIAQALQAARQYRAGYLLLEKDHPDGFTQLYKHPVDYPGMEFVKSLGDTRIFRLFGDS